MLLVEPAFLPLQPLAGGSGHGARTTLSALPASCSINSLRRSFRPFPLRPPVPTLARNPSTSGCSRRRSEPNRQRDEIVFTPMRSCDVERVQRLQSVCLPLGYPVSFFTRLLTNPSSLCLLATTPTSRSTLLGCASGHLLSYSHCTLMDDDEEKPPTLAIVYLTSLAVDELARNQGLGSRLIRDLVARLAPTGPRKAVLQLHVEARNAVAIRLYERVGLKQMRRIRGHYRGVPGGGDAIEMKGVVEL
ncbi:GNAT family N-acetyltransferase [Sporobolomyces koalae]|uniref:GNAT family N-acetyltransferase n=1 Tax=Sporobolomyces koalae TaxID=500713 RepID=UPI00316BC450